MRSDLLQGLSESEGIEKKAFTVIGGAGFLGSSLCLQLVRRGTKEVRSFDLNHDQSPFTPLLLSHDVRCITGDICKFKDVEKFLNGVDCVFHFASVPPFWISNLPRFDCCQSLEVSCAGTFTDIKLHSMNLLMYMAPLAALILLPFTLFIEGNVAAITIEKAQENPFIIFLLVGNMTIAYLVNLTNFLVTKHTSALTLQVLGNAKAAVATVISVLIFKNPVTVMGMSGFLVTIFGVILYSQAKKRFKAPH